MARKKAIKLREVTNFPHVFEEDDNTTEKDIRNYFSNENNISLEVGCGDGDYTIELAKLFPDRNFVGIDFKGARIYNGAKVVEELGIENAAFLWVKAEKLNEMFKEEKIEEIFITFPEPHIKRRAERHRLVSDKYLAIYREILIPGGIVHLKTDEQFLYDYAVQNLAKNGLNILNATNDLYSANDLNKIQSITTRYERYYLKEGRKIKYIEFVFG